MREGIGSSRIQVFRAEQAMDQEETELVAKITTGDADSLARFINLRKERLLAFIERQIGTQLRRKIEADDVLQEVSADAVRSLPTIELGDRDPFSWLCQLAERRVIDAHRHFFGAQKRNAAKEVGLGSPGGDTEGGGGLINLLVASMTTPSQAFSREAKEMRLQEALAQLPEDQREALRLRYVESMPSKEIAERIGKSDAAVRVMLTRSLKKLQEIMGDA